MIFIGTFIIVFVMLVFVLAGVSAFIELLPLVADGPPIIGIIISVVLPIILILSVILHFIEKNQRNF